MEPLDSKPANRANAFGALRLLLASLVIVSHVPEMMDGDRHREILTRIFGTLSFGEFAVNGFFLLSGALIATSMDRSRSVRAYITKRILRIYPAFAVCSVLCVLILAPAVGGLFVGGVPLGIAKMLLRIAVLSTPSLPHAFDGLPYALLNGAAWTIRFEFGCYLLVILLYKLGIIKSSIKTGLLTFSIILFYTVCVAGGWRYLGYVYAADAFRTGSPIDVLRLAGLFLAGATVRQWLPRLNPTPGRLLVAACVLSASFLHPVTVVLGFATAGAYLLFGGGIILGHTVLARVNNDPDISYGMYLYAWPLTNLLIWVDQGFSVFAITAMTWIGAALLGWASWHVIERPALAIGRRDKAATVPSVPSAMPM